MCEDFHIAENTLSQNWECAVVPKSDALLCTEL